MPNIALFFPGEMGSAVAKLLVENGWNVYSCLDGRSERTRKSAESADIHCVRNIDEALAGADFVLSLVPQENVIGVAVSVADSALKTGKRPLYVDGNSISPATIKKVQEILTRASIDCVDGVFIGNSKMLGGKTTFYLSGSKAEIIKDAFERSFKTIVLGCEIGLASAFKLSMYGFNKGLIAIFLDMVTSAYRIGHKDELIRCLNSFYPGTMDTVGRLLPTYPRHVRRRGQEMGEVVEWLQSIRHSDAMASGTKIIFEKFSELSLDTDRDWTVEEILAECCNLNFLQGS